MDVTDLARRLLRRWPAVLLVVVLAAAAGVGGASRVATSRQSSAAVVVVPPVFGDSATEQNPVLNLDNNLSLLATVLATALQAPAAVRTLQARGATGDYTVSTVTGANPSFAQLSPEIVFTATGATADEAKGTAAALVTLAGQDLTSLQDEARVARLARASVVQVVQPTSASVVGGRRLRSGGAIGLAVLVLGLLLVLLLDQLLARRRDRRRVATLPERSARRRARRRQAARDPALPDVARSR